MSNTTKRIIIILFIVTFIAVAVPNGAQHGASFGIFLGILSAFVISGFTVAIWGIFRLIKKLFPQH